MMTARARRQQRRDVINGAARGKPLAQPVAHAPEMVSALGRLPFAFESSADLSPEPARLDILADAAAAISGDRDDSYGGPEDSFSRIADLWTAHFGYQFDPGMVAQALALLKLARLAKNPAHRDSWVDLAGYAACGGEVAA